MARHSSVRVFSALRLEGDSRLRSSRNECDHRQCNGWSGPIRPRAIESRGELKGVAVDRSRGEPVAALPGTRARPIQATSNPASIRAAKPPIAIRHMPFAGTKRENATIRTLSMSKRKIDFLQTAMASIISSPNEVYPPVPSVAGSPMSFRQSRLDSADPGKPEGEIDLSPP